MPSNLPVQSKRVIGIDLGTTNTVVAEIIWSASQAGQPKARALEITQETREGTYTNVLVPSVVAITGGNESVGEGARRHRSKSQQLNLRRYVNLFFDCKNEIGLRMTYGRAPEGYRSATEIASRVLAAIWKEVLDQGPPPIRVVVTVPASFQAAQRRETLNAAELAGIPLRNGDLLDEPTAAFIDYAMQAGPNQLGAAPGQRLVVFDFGGGTCDVALFIIEKGDGATPALSPVGVSRYHRIGGSDIDARIVHNVLVPRLVDQNNIDLSELSFEDKKNRIEPALLGVAEALKIGLCRELQRLKETGQRVSASTSKRQPGRYECVLDSGTTLQIQSPTLTASAFAEVMKPFVDPDLLYAVETEYATATSLFRPLQDALDRAEWKPKDVDHILLTGGSSLIPDVQQAITSYFSGAQVLLHKRDAAWQTTVACGAAYHALALAVSGSPLFPVLTHDSVSVRSGSGLRTLLPKGQRLPWPADGGFSVLDELSVPQDVPVGGSCDLKLELSAGAGSSERVLFSEIWKIPGPVSRGEPLQLDYRMDESQCLELKVALSSDPTRTSFQAKIENPLTHVVNPLPKQARALEIEEGISVGEIATDDAPAALAELSDIHADLGHKERAVDDLRRAIVASGRPDAWLLGKLAIAYGVLGDHDREERYFREAAAVSTWGAPLFNLALSQWRRELTQDAVANVDAAIARERKPAYLVLRACLAESLGDSETRERCFEEANRLFGHDPAMLSDFELGWFVFGAQRESNSRRENAGRSEQQRRAKTPGASVSSGVLPEVRPSVVKIGRG